MVIYETIRHQSEPALDPYGSSLLGMPGQTNGRNWDFCQPTNRVSVLTATGKCFVLNFTPGSITVDIPSSNNGLAAIVAAQ